MTEEEIKTLFFELCDAQRFDYEVEYVASLIDRFEVRYPCLLDEYRAREGLPQAKTRTTRLYNSSVTNNSNRR